MEPAGEIVDPAIKAVLAEAVSKLEACLHYEQVTGISYAEIKVLVPADLSDDQNLQLMRELKTFEKRSIVVSVTCRMFNSNQGNPAYLTIRLTLLTTHLG